MSPEYRQYCKYFQYFDFFLFFKDSLEKIRQANHEEFLTKSYRPNDRLRHSMYTDTLTYYWQIIVYYKVQNLDSKYMLTKY